MDCEACGHKNVDGARFCANCGITLTVHTDSENPLIGKMVGGRFRITGVIGEGGMGIVYAGEQQMGTAVRKVAVKTLHKELSNDPSVTARFHRECGTVAQLEHPNTIKVYDFGAMDDGTLYIAMEFLDGTPLDKVIEQGGAMPPSRALKLLRQVAGSLEEAHNQGIIHRDLKPENVVLIERAGESDVVKLLDFGIAARTESADAEREAKLTQQGMVLGTPPYMSPEQFTGKALDHRSDIYSLAVMAYEMLTGKLPFDATTPWEWATEHMTAQPRPFETMEVSTQIPAGMRQAILKALSKDREERFKTAKEFVDGMSAGPDAVIHTGKMESADDSTATAAMGAVPDFGSSSGPAPTAAMPAQGGPGSGPSGGVAVAAVPPAPTTTSRGSGGSGKGLIIGLGAVAVVLVGGLALALVGGGSDDEPSSDPFVLETSSPQPTEPTSEAFEAEADQVEADDETTDEADDDSTDDTVVASQPKRPTAPARPPTTKPTPKPTPNPTPITTPAPIPKTPTPPPSVDASKSCSQCISAAGRGSIVSAAGYYHACSNAGKKGQCSARAKQRAPVAARQAARTKNCNKARQIQAAANSMGAGSGSLNSIVSSCK